METKHYLNYSSSIYSNDSCPEGTLRAWSASGPRANVQLREQLDLDLAYYFSVGIVQMEYHENHLKQNRTNKVYNSMICWQ